MKFSIRIGDTVQVARGSRNRNPEKPSTRGRVLRIDRRKGRVWVESHNMRVKHLKKSQQHPQGGRLEREMSVALSNVMVVTGGGDAVSVRQASRAEDGSVVLKPGDGES